MTSEGLATIRDVLHRFEAALDGDPRDAGELDAEFHLAIYGMSESELLNVLRGYWARLQLQLSERVYSAELPRRFVREHRAIVDALERRDAALAGELMAAHIEHGRATMASSLRAT
jgi:DNA-binding GntR family transcriptional regulator